MLFDSARPVMLNGIEDIVTRPDLADRSLFLSLEPIPEDRRRPEAELWAAFEAERPRILGALLDAVVMGVAQLPHTKLDRLPRMADFALWATACETALWPRGTFWSAYGNNRDDAVESVIDADPIATAVRAFVANRTDWAGTATELLTLLGEIAGERVAKSKSWPESARALAGGLRRAATFLRKIGIEIGFGREGRGRARIIRITAMPEPAGGQPSIPSASSLPILNSNSIKDFPISDVRTVGTDADGTSVSAIPIVPSNPLNNNEKNAADRADLSPSPQSGQVEQARVIERLNHHPVQSSDIRCLVCGEGDRELDALLPFGAPSNGHTWLHSDCWQHWMTERQAQAIKALSDAGDLDQK